MAIRRCPYCKAIIDEQDKYCNNCGTQLLFPEDEYVEEEIPGDKIVEEPEEEERVTEELDEKEEPEEREPAEEEEDVEEMESPTAEIKTVELAGKPVQVDEPHKKYKVSIEEDELVFKTKELEGLTDTVEEGKEKAKAVTSH